MEKTYLAIATCLAGLVIGSVLGFRSFSSSAPSNSFSCSNGSAQPGFSSDSAKFGSGTENAAFGGSLNATSVISSGNVTSTGSFLGSTTGTLGVNAGSVALFSRGATTSTFDISATGTCMVTRRAPDGTQIFWSITTNGWASSTASCI